MKNHISHEQAEALSREMMQLMADVPHAEPTPHAITKKVIGLIAAGADPDYADQSGFTPLTVAAFIDNVKIAKALIEAGADINLQDKRGQTPLTMSVVSLNSLDITRFLIDKGVDYDARNGHGHNFIDCAPSFKKEIVEELWKKGEELRLKKKIERGVPCPTDIVPLKKINLKPPRKG